MNRFFKVSLLFGLLALLTACGTSGEEELQAWIAEQRATARPRVTLLTEPKDFKPQGYGGDGALDPFAAGRLTQALRRDSAQIVSRTLR